MGYTSEQETQGDETYGPPIALTSALTIFLAIAHAALGIAYGVNEVTSNNNPQSGEMFHVWQGTMALVYFNFAWFFAGTLHQMVNLPSLGYIIPAAIFSLGDLTMATLVRCLTNVETECAAKLVKDDTEKVMKNALFRCGELKKISTAHMAFAMFFCFYTTFLFVARRNIKQIKD